MRSVFFIYKYGVFRSFAIVFRQSQSIHIWHFVIDNQYIQIVIIDEPNDCGDFEMEKTVPNSISTRCRRKYLVIAGLVLLVIIQLYFLYLPYIRVMSVGTITATTNNNNNKDVDDIKAIVVESSIKSERILPDIYHCYHKNGSNSHLRYIEDLLTASIQPALDKTIYFVISTCFKDDLIAIRKR